MRPWLILCLTLGPFSTWARTCDKTELTLVDSIFKVEVSRLGDREPSPKSVIIMPPSGGSNLIDRSYARKFCQRGFDAYVMNRWSEDDEYDLDLEIHQRFYERGQRAIGTLLKNLKSPFIGLLGTSVGAQHSLIAAGSFKKISAVFVIVGGVPIPDILAHSSQEILATARKARFAQFGLNSKEEYARAIDSVFFLDPLKRGRPQKKLGMIISMNDTMVPTRYQLKLKDFWKPQKVIISTHNHFFSIIFAWLFHSDEIVDHFD